MTMHDMLKTIKYELLIFVKRIAHSPGNLT